jgi:serine/threonine protein kinase
MEKYCCFNCPQSDYTEKNLEDLCPKCLFPYGFPLNEGTAPTKIKDLQVIKALSRGYYGVTYIVEKLTTIRTKKMVLKVVPKEIYKFFNKNFEEECRYHAIAADGAQHIVDIDDVFDADIDFGNTIIPCHIAILDYIEGETLKSLLENEEPLKASTIGQIAIDLLKILLELHAKQLFHNDLHPGNIIIQKLKDENKRVGELDEYIKAVAIDFGSLGEKTQSGDKSHRIGDLHWVAKTLDILSQKILDNPYNSEERDYRLASLLEERARILFPRVTSLRVYEFDEVITQIKNAFIQVDSPWRQTLSLRNFKDSYNAQTLAPWFVPSLLVDDDDRWISEICNRGPQVITGMRGCGKTMLIRALQFHARAIPRDADEERDSKFIIQRLKKEGYLGLYVSCTRLLDKLGDQDQPLHEPFARLFIAYALEAIVALRHLRELDRTTINPDSFKIIAEVISTHIEGAEYLKELQTEIAIERYMKNILNSLCKSETVYTINSNPANTFPQLATAIKQCSTIWQNHYVFFLLDDVSTRFLNDQNIIHLVSSLLFQNEFCSFKFTTEAQTLEMVINSPGNIEQARIGRDYNIFDLGHHVNEKIHSNKKEGIAFVEKILFKRANFHSSHPKNLTPSQILGDVSLQSIAENIAKSGKAFDKKGLYHGITAIAGVCVGDIGDVITLYEMILKKRNLSIPVSAINQNECYLDLCNSRLFDIDRREGRLFDFAESFAEAAHFLLVQSYKRFQNSGKKRLRQYSSIFINVSDGDIEKQNKQVRELIDAGIFNFSGGPQASRTNRQGVNPQQQFKLTYRKLYGINKHIGLAQSDRFELSGEALEDWLNNPKNGKEILIRNLRKETDEEYEIDALNDYEKEDIINSDNSYQKTIFDDEIKDEMVDDLDEVRTIEMIAKEKTPITSFISYEELRDTGISQIMVGLGFEESTFESFKKILQIEPQKATLIKFKEVGKSKEIFEILDELNIKTKEIDYSDAITGNDEIYSDNTLFDITGFPQSIIFNSIRNSLINQKKVNFAYTAAKTYYPLDEDIERLLIKYEAEDQTHFLESLSDILKGEQGPYKLIPLLPKEINPSARRVLIAFSSPKHERLFTLLDEREYDKILIIVPAEDGPRNKLAKIAAEVALRKYNHAEIIKFGSDSLQQIMEYLSLQYQNYFVNQNFSFEIAITGSKLQTVASAAICATFKVNQCWYLQPYEWDPKRFTKGATMTKLYSIIKT